MRRPDWAHQMFTVFDAHKDAVFEWAVNDCCLLAARVVDAMTDSTHEATVKSMYSTELEAKKLLASRGLEAMVNEVLGIEAIVARPGRGDLVLYDSGDSLSLGVWDGRSIVGLTDKGLAFSPRADVIKVWKV